MGIRKSLIPTLRVNLSQGFLECASVLLVFALAAYSHFGDAEPLLTLLVAIPLIALNLYDSFLHKYYWNVLLPMVLFFGIFCAYPSAMYAVSQAALYFQMVKGINRVFTAGEHLINSFILISLLRFSMESPTAETMVTYYPVSNMHTPP